MDITIAKLLANRDKIQNRIDEILLELAELPDVFPEDFDPAKLREQIAVVLPKFASRVSSACRRHQEETGTEQHLNSKAFVPIRVRLQCDRLPEHTLAAAAYASSGAHLSSRLHTP